MFYGLSNFFKRILPKRLFYRALLIVAVPVLVLQLVITIVFFDSLWIKTNKGMTRTLVNEISTFFEAYESEKTNKQSLVELFSLFLTYIWLGAKSPIKITVKLGFLLIFFFISSISFLISSLKLADSFFPSIIIIKIILGLAFQKLNFSKTLMLKLRQLVKYQLILN